MTISLIYDNTLTPPQRIREMLGINSFGSIRLRRQRLRDFMLELAGTAGLGIREVVDTAEERAALRERMLDAPADHRYVYFPANLFIAERDAFCALIAQLRYSDRDLVAGGGFHEQMFLLRRDEARALLLAQANDTEREHILRLLPDLYDLEDKRLWFNLFELHNFLTLLSGGTDARDFNQIKSEGRFLRKSSNKVEKIKKEHDYFWLLPDNMKPFVVMPFGLQVGPTEASYCMEQVHAPDMAVQWTYHSLSEREFQQFLDDIFEFINCRKTKKVNSAEMARHIDDLYIRKTQERFVTLQKMPIFPALDRLVTANSGRAIAEIVESYVGLVKNIKRSFRRTEVAIGHGDLCLSNILYDKTTRQLKLIDPRGAATEEELWTEPTYDVAKLSHSVLGGYDYVNRFMFDIVVGDDLSFSLRLEAEDQSALRRLFCAALADQGFDIRIVRLYEAGLFLSMLPLHAEAPKKLMAFIMIAADILEEWK